jgi:hypothetical protein
MISHGKETATIRIPIKPAESCELTSGTCEEEKNTHHDDQDSESTANGNLPFTRTITTTTTTVVKGNASLGGTGLAAIKVNKIASALEERTGRWTHDENLQFLIGLKVVGVGKWNKLAAFCPKRYVRALVFSQLAISLSFLGGSFRA